MATTRHEVVRRSSGRMLVTGPSIAQDSGGDTVGFVLLDPGNENNHCHQSASLFRGFRPKSIGRTFTQRLLIARQRFRYASK